MFENHKDWVIMQVRFYVAIAIRINFNDYSGRKYTQASGSGRTTKVEDIVYTSIEI